MYALAKEHRSAKLFAKTRRTLVPKKLENFDTSIKRDAKDLSELCLITKPLLNGNHFGPQNSTVEISEQHEAMIRYINGSWSGIKQELDSVRKQSATESSNASVADAQPAPRIKHINGSVNTSKIPKNFVPFDLESFWGQRLYQNLLQST